ncbi:G2-specific kinase nima [Pyrenophora seminiperda CCB06]|uniref:G2-specific kinase nima n=1 Tax=Pyrenophora seminiperda CCB06 TaxID=1302712 RepID=A0A3M7LW08_9PLEO|nr:G2-specific kinase nima [Pyrenophora seminiperda CCB06]
MSGKLQSAESFDIPYSSTEFPKDYKFNKQIQKGSQGCVNQWTHVPSDTVIAVKVIRHIHPTPNEVVVLRKLPPHRSIVGYLDYYENQPNSREASLILEYCPFGDLHDFSQQEGKSAFSEAFMLSVYSQLMSALALLHEGIDAQNPQGRDRWRPIVHQDIKMENVLVKSVGLKPDWSDLELKLGDFGMVEYYNPHQPNPLGYVGTTSSWSPEITWSTKRFTPASDVWAAASIIHELAHDFGPIVSSNIIRKKWYLENKDSPFPSTWPKSLKLSYWVAIAPRRVIPINLDPEEPIPILSDYNIGYDERALRYRKQKPSPKYSDALNDCLMAGLKISPDERSGSGKLLR